MNSALAFLLLVGLAAAIPVNLMLPLHLVENGELINPEQLAKDFQQLRAGGVYGVMGDVWWGLVETAPRVYNWAPYLQLAALCKNASLYWQPVMSFHRCGGNVDDDCNIPIPQFVRDVGNKNPDIFYHDMDNGLDYEYLSLGVDHEPLFGGRTPVQIYRDFMQSFHDTFKEYMGSIINEIQVGLGPAGELRFPSYQLDRWKYCGVGEFQMNDRYMLQSLAAAATAAGHPEWGKGGPSNAGNYYSSPSNTGFFGNGFDNYSSAYGKFFLTWYSSVLMQHGEDVLAAAREVFQDEVELAGKISGIHWWYKDGSHAAELTAGYYNTNGNDGYRNIAETVFSKYNITMDFTCFEMKSYDDGCKKDPENLVYQTKKASRSAGILYSGENAIEQCNPNCYQGGFDQIYYQSTRDYPIHAFTYLRMTRNLLDNADNWKIFSDFIGKMKKAD